MSSGSPPPPGAAAADDHPPPGFTALPPPAPPGFDAPLSPGSAGPPPPLPPPPGSASLPPDLLLPVDTVPLDFRRALAVRKGYDVHAKLLDFNKGERLNTVVLGCEGSLSRVTIHHPPDIIDTVYEGLFLIRKLEGGFLWNENEGVSRRRGRLNIIISTENGDRGGRVSGPMIAGVLDPAQMEYYLLGLQPSTDQHQTD